MTVLAKLGKALESRAHLDASLVSEGHLAPLVAERQRALRIATADLYVERALASTEELDHLRDLIAVPETWLFRYPESFALLRRRLMEERPATFRALSVACATGAEPFSIAAAALAAGVPPGTVRVVAVDSSLEALSRARTGDLPQLAAREGIPAWAERWFRQDEGCIRADSAVLQAVEWMHGAAPKVLSELDAQPFDAVFCRNLAIYLSPAARRALGRKLCTLLSPRGVLFLGHAEPPHILGAGRRLKPMEPRASFAFCAEELLAAAECDGPRSAPVRARPVPRTRTRPRRPTAAGSPTRTVPGAPPHAEPPTVQEIRAAADEGRLAEAVRMAEERSKAGDDSSPLLLILGSAHAALGNHDAAEEALRKVAYLEPSHAEALLQLAALAERRGDSGMASRYRGRAARAQGGEP